MYLKSQNLKEWRFWYKLIAVILIIGFLVADYTFRVIDIASINQAAIDGNKDYSGWEIFSAQGKIIGQDYLGFTIFYLGYFTTQSNLLVLLFFIVSMIKHNFDPQLEGHKSGVLSRSGSFLIALYILITGIIYNVILLPSGFIGEHAPINIWKDIIVQEIGHGIVPILMLVYVLCVTKCVYKNVKWWPTFFIKDFGLAVIYPILYFVAALVRGQLIYTTYGGVSDFTTSSGEVIKNAGEYIEYFNIRAFQYFFLDVNTTMGKIFMPIALIMILFIILGFGALITKGINLRSAKLIDPEAYKANKIALKTARKEKKAAESKNKKEIKKAEAKLENKIEKSE